MPGARTRRSVGPYPRCAREGRGGSWSRGGGGGCAIQPESGGKRAGPGERGGASRAGGCAHGKADSGEFGSIGWPCCWVDGDGAGGRYGVDALGETRGDGESGRGGAGAGRLSSLTITVCAPGSHFGGDLAGAGAEMTVGSFPGRSSRRRRAASGIKRSSPRATGRRLRAGRSRHLQSSCR